jgi:uncharacterized protein YdgA (DUF945 family)
MVMKRILLLIVFLIFIMGSSSIPYWTGVEAERQFTHFNHEFYPKTNLKLVDSTYQRGWFHSYSESTFEPMGVSGLNSKEHHFTLAHEIDHGFLPIQKTLIRTTLHSSSPPKTPLTEVVLQKDHSVPNTPLLEMQTIVQTNGDSVSTLKMPALALKDDNAYLQWQGLQGNVTVKHNFAAIQAEIYSPQILLKMNQEQIMIQGLSLNTSIQPSEANFIQGSGGLNIANIQLTGKQIQSVKLKGIKLVGNNNIVSNNLMVTLQTSLTQIVVGGEHYGPSYADFEIQNWHVPALSRIKNTLVEIYHQGSPIAQQLNMAMFQLMPHGLTFLKNTPEFAINRLKVNTPKGELRGKIRVKVEESFEGNFLVLFNPSLLLNALNIQLEMFMPQSLLGTEKTVSNTFTTPNWIKQYLKMWQKRGILRPAKNQPNYYYSQMQLSGGILQVNGQQLPVASLLK